MLDYLRIACAVPAVRVGDVRRNTADIIAMMDRAEAAGADVLVLPEYQKSGIGRHMLTEINKWFEERAKDGSCIMINLMATSGNEGFYAKFGFTARPNDTMGAGMVKWLNS